MALTVLSYHRTFTKEGISLRLLHQEITCAERESESITQTQLGTRLKLIIHKVFS